MRILLVGGGGREHALAWKISESPLVDVLLAAPGNPGIARHATCVGIGADAHDELVALARRERIDLTVVGPEVPLVAGLADRLSAAGLSVFGPSARAAAIEGSKAFAKALLARHGIPTARFATFDDPARARRYCRDLGTPLVVKADGLAAGKGAIVCRTLAEADDAIALCMERRVFGASGTTVVVEEFLVGEEISFFALSNGGDALAFGAAQDHKAVLDGDRGPNTGGMGAYCPAPIGTPELIAELEREVFVPTVHAMKRGRFPFQGVLYAGMMLTNQGPRVLEFNVRFGDPETQPMLMRLKSDLVDLLEAVADDRLHELEGRVEWDPRPAVCVVLCSAGYPGRTVRCARSRRSTGRRSRRPGPSRTRSPRR